MHMNDTGTKALSGLAPGQPLADAQRQLKKDGCLMVAGLCDPSFVAHLLDVSRRRSGEVMTTLGAQPIGIGSAAGFGEVVQRVANQPQYRSLGRSSEDVRPHIKNGRVELLEGR